MGRVGEKGHKEGHEEEVGRQRKEKAGEGRMDGRGTEIEGRVFF
jgi:hypothetical protein